MIKNFLVGLGKDKERFREIESEMRLQKLAEQKTKSANERELEGYIKKDREAAIKRQLDFRRQKDTREMYKATLLKGKMLFVGHKSVLSQDKNVLHNGKINMLKGGIL